MVPTVGEGRHNREEVHSLREKSVTTRNAESVPDPVVVSNRFLTPFESVPDPVVVVESVPDPVVESDPVVS